MDKTKVAATLEDAFVSVSRGDIMPEEYVEISRVFWSIGYNIASSSRTESVQVIMASPGAGVTTGFNWMVRYLAENGINARRVDAYDDIHETAVGIGDNEDWALPHHAVALVLKALIDVAKSIGDSMSGAVSIDDYEEMAISMMADCPENGCPNLAAVNALADGIKTAIGRYPVVLMDGLEKLTPGEHHLLYDTRRQWMTRFQFPVVFTAGIYESASDWWSSARRPPVLVQSAGSDFNLQPNDEGVALMDMVLHRMDASLIDIEALGLASRFSGGPRDMLRIISDALLMAMRRKEINPEAPAKVTVDDVTYEINQRISMLSARYDSSDYGLLVRIRNYRLKDGEYRESYADRIEGCVEGGALIPGAGNHTWQLHPQMLSFQVGSSLGVKNAGFAIDDSAGKVGWYVEKVGVGYIRDARIFRTLGNEVILLLTDGVGEVKVPASGFYEDVASARKELAEYQLGITTRFAAWNLQDSKAIIGALMSLAMGGVRGLSHRNLYEELGDNVLPSERDAAAIMLSAVVQRLVMDGDFDDSLSLSTLMSQDADEISGIWNDSVKSMRRYLTDVSEDLKNGRGVYGLGL